MGMGGQDGYSPKGDQRESAAKWVEAKGSLKGRPETGINAAVFNDPS